MSSSFESQVIVLESCILSLESRVSSLESGIWDLRFQVLELGYQGLEPRLYKTPDPNEDLLGVRLKKCRSARRSQPLVDLHSKERFVIRSEWTNKNHANTARRIRIKGEKPGWGRNYGRLFTSARLWKAAVCKSEVTRRERERDVFSQIGIASQGTCDGLDTIDQDGLEGCLLNRTLSPDLRFGHASRGNYPKVDREKRGLWLPRLDNTNNDQSHVNSPASELRLAPDGGVP
ncbi:unnamed protein product [Protopolystoma xenopodis]|uniref:Uncharacterized protein n=1 Tax=Protopolystoma xenopodis TaxID=117903 RepID=A0A3S4ZXZ6_9PLAT|nr:unnamed protein product [Protopolystoma xenopodis]